jgi:hypothetical protein
MLSEVLLRGARSCVRRVEGGPLTRRLRLLLLALMILPGSTALAEARRPLQWQDGPVEALLQGPVRVANEAGRAGMAPALGATRGPSRGLAGGLDLPPFGRMSVEAGPGVNLNFFDLDKDCEREPFGVLASYHLPGVRAEVSAQLIELRARGSESIGVGIFHLRAPVPSVEGVVGTGTLVDSTGGRLHPRIQQNLQMLLADVQASGFRQLLLRFHPQAENDAARWANFSEDLFQENWNLIVSVMPLLEALDMDWRVDLMVEGMPRSRFYSVFGQLVVLPTDPDNEPWSRYANRLWQNYVSRFDPARSVGFSILADPDPDRLRARLEHTSFVYRLPGGERIYPGAFAFDFYGRSGVDEGAMYRQSVDRLQRLGLGGIPLLIAETWYNDREALASLYAAMRETGTRPLYVLHWPADRRFLDCSPDVNVHPPVEIDQLLRFGF